MKRIYITVTLLFFLLAAANAQNNLPQTYTIETDEIDYILDSNFVQVLPDAKIKLGIKEVAGPAFDALFKNIYAFKETEEQKANNYWLRFRIKNTTGYDEHISLVSGAEKANFYVVDSTYKITHYKTGYGYNYKQRDGIKSTYAIPITLTAGKTVTVYYERYVRGVPGLPMHLQVTLLSTAVMLAEGLEGYESKHFSGIGFYESTFFGILILAAIFNFFFYRVVKEKVYLFFSLFLVAFAFTDNNSVMDVFFSGNHFMGLVLSHTILLSIGLLIQFVRYYFKTNQLTPKWDKVLVIFSIPLYLQFLVGVADVKNLLPDVIWALPIIFAVILLFITMLLMYKKAGAIGRFFLIAIAPIICSLFFLLVIDIMAAVLSDANVAMAQIQTWLETWGDNVISFSVCWAVVVFSWALFNRYNMQRREIAQQLLDKERLAKEKEIERNELIAAQKILLEQEVAERTAELKQSLEELKATQSQLIQSEKMASLGELTAGIAHEIQNPLNFVNNFSEVSKELIDELVSEKAKVKSERDEQLEDELLADVKQNLEKINSHGKRADAIVKGMLQHSRKTAGHKEPTDINALVDEYLRLCYHGILEKDKNCKTIINPAFDESIGNINIIPQDVGRVLLNLYNNAFYAVAEKAKIAGTQYTPAVSVSTKLVKSASGSTRILITVADNGTGIPQHVIDKIFQPFFTTKPTGHGTGLGLSLSYDIIKAHGGEIKVNTQQGEGTTFTIELPGKSAL